MQIERVEVQVVGPETRRYTWSHDLPEQFQSNTILRLFTDSGPVAMAAVWNAASYEHDHFTAESLRHLMPGLIGRDPYERGGLLYDLRPRVWPIPPGALALIDIALWDFEARAKEIPLFRLLAGDAAAARDRIPAYASTPMFESISEYLSISESLIEQGFKAIKYHTWCIPQDDLALARAARQHLPGVALMLDAENNYQLEDAMRVADELADLDFAWFEAPLPDSDLRGYRELTAASRLPIVPSGNWVRDLSLFEDCLATGAWSASRADVVILDGITPACRAMRASADAGMNCELMSWGYTLASAANLHVMLSHPNCTYYEQPLPYDLFEYGMIDVIRPDANGLIHGPNAPGLGLQVDWDAMDARTIVKLVCDRNGVRAI